MNETESMHPMRDVKNALHPINLNYDSRINSSPQKHFSGMRWVSSVFLFITIHEYIGEIWKWSSRTDLIGACEAYWLTFASFFFVSWGLLGKLNVQDASVMDGISKTQVYEIESDYGAFAFKPNCLSRSKMNRRPEPIYLLHFSNVNNLWARCNLKFIGCTLLPTVPFDLRCCRRSHTSHINLCTQIRLWLMSLLKLANFQINNNRKCHRILTLIGILYCERQWFSKDKQKSYSCWRGCFFQTISSSKLFDLK